MPARTSIFQRLVLEIHRDIGPGWRVAESRLLTDTVTGEPREVDIVGEAIVGRPRGTLREAEGDIVNCESVPGKTGSLSVSSYSSHSMVAIHYVPLSPRVEQGNMSRSPFGTPVTAAV